MSYRAGGFSELKEASEEVVELCVAVRLDVQKITDKVYKLFSPIQFREQELEGKNFLIKVHVGEGNCVHVIVNQTCEGVNNVANVQENHSRDDALNPF